MGVSFGLVLLAALPDALIALCSSFSPTACSKAGAGWCCLPRSG